MLRGFVLGAGLCCVLAVLFGVGYSALGDPGHPSFLGTAKPISMIPITQTFRLDLGKVGHLQGKGQSKPFVVTAPGTAGIAITEIMTPDQWNGDWELGIQVNGVTMLQTPLGTRLVGIQHVIRPDPPIVVPPGGTLVIGTVAQNTNEAAELRIGGYYLTLEDLGWK